MKENGKKAVNEKNTAAEETAVQTAETAGKAEARKKLSLMSLMEDFLFGAMVTYPVIGEQFVRKLLKIILGITFGRIIITAQKVLYGTDADLRGARLDVYIDPENMGDSGERATVYDVEPDRNDKKSDREALPRRVRFYHGKIIARDLNAGAEFRDLKNVVILMILSYDPFGLDRMIYTIENGCREVPEMSYDDGAKTVFLYTKGTEGVPNEEVRELLHYMEETTSDNAVNDDLKEMHQMVETVKEDPETSLGYWKMMHKQIRMQREAEEKGMAEGIAKGIAKGMAEGIAKGMAKGMAEGMSKGMAEGELMRLISQVCKKMKLNQSSEKIAEDLVEELSVIEPICNTAGEFAPDYDPEAVYERINADREDAVVVENK